jgi:hypothetical protein
MKNIFNAMKNLPNSDQINKELLKKLMSNDFTKSDFVKNYSNFGFPKLSFSANNIVYTDTTHLYTTNSNGFRSRELDNTELLFAGCSMTFGVGIQEDAIWGNQLAKEFGYSAINLSEPGVGVDKIINYIFSYLKKYEPPKLILCLFPDFGRMLYPFVKDLVSSKNRFKPINYDLEVHTIQLNRHMDSSLRPSFDKKPYAVENTVPFELAFLKSINQIMILDQYCKSHNIPFYWGTWHVELNDVITEYNKINNIYDNFVSMDVGSWVVNDIGKEKFSLCSKEEEEINNLNFNEIPDHCHKHIKEKFLDTFYGGLDINHVDNPKLAFPHPGSHRHAHYADSFINFIKTNKI